VAAVDDFKPDDAGVDDFFSTPAPPPVAKPAPKPAASAPAPTSAPAPAPAPPPPRQKFEESDSDDEVKPNPFMIQDEDVGDDSVAVQQKAATELPKPTVSKSLTPLSWRTTPAVETKPAAQPQPKVSIDINALVAGFLQDAEPSGGFEAIPEGNVR
jgi:hypothetical protein